MTGVDHTIYFKQEVPKFGTAILSGLTQGMKMRDQVDKRNFQQAEMQRLDQLRAHESEIQNALSQSIVKGADGSSSIDNKIYQSNIANLAGSNPLAAQKLQEFNLGLEQRQRDTQKFEADQQQRGLDNQFRQAQMRKLNAETNQLMQKPTDPISKLTEAEKTVDKTFGKDYVDWTSGGRQSALSEINKLEGVVGRLGDKVTTGGLTGMLPDRLTSNDVLSARSDVQSTVMNSLRAILGAAFTEKEGERVIRNTWNEADSTENNKARLQRLVDNLKDQAAAKDAQSNYYEGNRTLSGYKPVSEINMSPRATKQDSEAVSWAKKNPNDPRSAAILKANGFGG